MATNQNQKTNWQRFCYKAGKKQRFGSDLPNPRFLYDPMLVALEKSAMQTRRYQIYSGRATKAKSSRSSFNCFVRLLTNSSLKEQNLNAETSSAPTGVQVTRMNTSKL